MKYYYAIVDELLDYEIELIVTISFYETLLALTQNWNSWVDERTIDCYLRYTLLKPLIS